MKKSLTILLMIILSAPFIACSDDDKNEPDQAYTSFVFKQDFTDYMSNVIFAYMKDGKYIRLAELGDVVKNIPSKEIRVDDPLITELHLFSDYPAPSIKTDFIFKLRKNKKNIFEIPNDTRGLEIKDIKDPSQYPQ